MIDEFVDAYTRGETPIPCVRCTQTVKFRDLLDPARELGAEALATGHYVKRGLINGRATLERAVDPGKDQSYFLFATTQEQLDYLRFPLGEQTKAETRDHAARFNLPVAEKPDSQDICFVPNGSYATLVKKLRPDAAIAGDIVDLSGEKLGRHDGVVNYTIGQRRRLGIGGRSSNEGDSEPLYGVRIDAVRNEVVVGPHAVLATPDIRLTAVNWLGDRKLSTDPYPISVKIRSIMKPVAASITADALGDVVVRFDTPEFGVSPGQAAVFYDGDRVLGGGWIIRGQDDPAAGLPGTEAQQEPTEHRL